MLRAASKQGKLKRRVRAKRANAGSLQWAGSAVSQMNRKALDALAARHRLSADAIATALVVTNARPSVAELARFCARVARVAGVLSAAAGLVFLVAANWEAITIFARFALVQAALVAAVGLALWRPPPHTLGRYALLAAFVTTGALLALFGQTYQTGADVYELFVSWTLLGLPFVIAARASVVSAAWLLVANIALFLYCGFRPETGPFWLLFSDWGLSLLLVPLVANTLLWLGSAALEGTRWSDYAPRWLGRIALAFGVAAGTWAGVAAILGFGMGTVETSDTDETVALLASLAVLAGIAVYALRRRTDVFPLALIAGSAIALSSTAIARFGDTDLLGLAFMLAVWLIVSSTVCGKVLMSLVRAWQREEVQA